MLRVDGPPHRCSARRDWPLNTPEHFRAAFEELFRRYGVDVYIAGHKHYFERTGRIFAGARDANGTMHIVNGAAGNNEGLDPVGAFESKLIVNGEYSHTGFGELELTAATATQPARLTWRYRLSANRSVVDEVLVPRRR